MSDLIRRQDAIELIENESRKWGDEYGISDVLCDLADLPSAQPAVDSVEVVRCKDCRWGREACGNIECFVDSNIPSEYHGYEWFCPNGERGSE